MLGSAKLNGLDPEIYLQHVLERIADHPISKINELLPWNVSLTTHTHHPHKDGSDHTLTLLLVSSVVNIILLQRRRRCHIQHHPSNAAVP